MNKRTAVNTTLKELEIIAFNNGFMPYEYWTEIESSEDIEGDKNLYITEKGQLFQEM